ncbi:MAG: transcription repressor NadR [Eubacteriales bacterium]|jgi:transcriptional regulator of NAD metabolism
MNAAERRKAIWEILQEQEGPVSATALARQLHVSRQIIVGDVALLRASNHAISATPRGYIVEAGGGPGLRRTIACRHDWETGLREELYTIVDNGAGVLDVTVEHPVYGQLSGQLQLFSRYDVDDFIRRLAQDDAQPLSCLTGGVHLHTILCADEAMYQRVLKQLEEKGILLTKE